ncbi:MAG: hypothetical protein ABI175_18330 [Polyangiales bacterium]
MAAPTDPAIRSVRIAATLNERFGTIMRAPVTQAGGMGELELRIGEAQQIYPEIWTHMDEARATLAARGVDTSAYDKVRATEPKGSLGVSRVEVEGYSTSLTTGVLGIHDEQVKTAQFNIEGFRRANQAVQALMKAMHEVDWKAIEHAENAEIAAAGSLGPVDPKALGKWIAILGGAGVAVYAFWYLLIRTPPHDYVAERKVRIVEYTKVAEDHPCKKSAVETLANDLAWDKPPIPTTQTRAFYRGACKDHIAGLETALAANACDKASLAALQIALEDRDGHVDAGMSAKNEYAARCKDKP